MAQSINISGLQHCGVCASMPPLPPCIPAATCIPTVPLPRPATAQYRVYMCTYLCLRVPAKLAQHLERISVPLFCSHCLEWAKGGQVQGSTGSCFIFPFISILTLPCNHPHSRLFSMPGPITREMVGGGKPGDGPQYKKKTDKRRKQLFATFLPRCTVIPISFLFLELSAGLMVIIVGKTP